MDWLKDGRTDSWSCMTKMKIDQYLELAELPHKDSGGIEGQRDQLKTTTAKRIRERLVADIIKGAVPPPIVIGIVADSSLAKKLPLKAENGNLGCGLN